METLLSSGQSWRHENGEKSEKMKNFRGDETKAGGKRVTDGKVEGIL